MRPEIVFVYPHYQDYLFAGFVEHYGNACIQSYLGSLGVPSGHYLSEANRALDWHVDRLLAIEPRAVGFTMFDTSYYLCELMAKLIKRKRPEVMVIGGGPSATFSHHVIYGRPGSPFDLLVRGYGELPMAALFHGGAAPSEVPSAVWRRDGEVVVNPMAPFFEELDDVPSPYLAGILAPELVFRVGTSTSRGCVFHCTYCNFSAMSNFQIHYHSEERVLEELRYVVAQTRAARDGKKLILTFLDDTFTMHRRRTQSILRQMIDEGVSDEVLFNCDTRGDSLDRELLELLRRAGCYSMNFGLESGSPRVLNVIKKKRCADGSRDGYAVESRYLGTIQESVRLAEEVGINTCVSVILGLPTESPEEGRQTLDFVRGLANHSYAHNYLQVYKGTEAYATADQHGISVRSSPTGLPYVTDLAYDALALPMIEGKTTVNLSVRKNGQLNDHLSSMTSLRPAMKEGDPPAFIFFHGRADELDGELLAGLRRHVTPSTRLYLLESDAAGIAALYARLMELELPLTGVYFLERDGRSARLYLLDRGERTTLSRAFSNALETLPFARHGELLADYGERNSQDWIGVLTLDGREDVEHLGELAAVEEATGLYALPYNLVYYKQGLQDPCRWANGNCRDTFQRGVSTLHVDRQGGVRLCLHGPAVGHVGEDPALWSRRMEEAVAAAEAARGCNTCPVTDRCSHCAAPHPVSAEGFCAFRNRHPRAGDFVALYELKNRLKGGQTDYFKKEAPSEQIVMKTRGRALPLVYEPPAAPAPLTAAVPERLGATIRFKDEKRLVVMKGLAHVVDLRTHEVVQVTRPLAEIWEALEMKRPVGEMLDFFSSRYELPPAEVLEKIETALDIFEEHGFLV
jgi:radical SAM superfamily enzyme YgiQ (UPF0313 family)